MRTSLLTLLVLVGALAAVRAQAPGEYPRLVLDDGQGNAVPGPADPFDSSGVFQAAGGLTFSADLSYLAEAQPNSDVPFGLLVSLNQTPFPVDVLPPPLFTMPPLVFVTSDQMMLDPAGEASLPLSIPPGLIDGTTYVQAIVMDVTSTPSLKLSNGVKLTIGPPAYSVAFSFARSGTGFGTEDMEGVGALEIDGDTLNTLVPIGPNVAPTPDLTDTGLPGGIFFQPIGLAMPDAPINPLAQPVTRLTSDFGASDNIDVFEVEDTSFFPPEGFLLVAEGEDNPWDNRVADVNLPDVELVTYTGKTATSFTGVERKQLGSHGANNYSHVAGEFVVGEYTYATTAAAQSRTRPSMDVTNPDLPHVVVPAFTFDEGSGPVTMELDLFRYEVRDTREQGFMVLDHVTDTWRVIGGTSFVSTVFREWDQRVVLSPDGRVMIACVRVDSGGQWDQAQDEIWAIRLDGLPWPATGNEAWQITYPVSTPEPVDSADDNIEAVRSHKVMMPSVAIIGTPPNDYVAFVGLGYKFEQTARGDGRVQTSADVWVGYEGAWAREEILVRDYIDIPLVAPGSGDALPAMPRQYIVGDFGTNGAGDDIVQFDPVPLVGPGATRMLIAAGAVYDEQDIFIVRNVSVTPAGGASRQVLNLAGLGFDGNGADSIDIRGFQPGGHGEGSKAAFSPDGSRVAWLGGLNVARDWIQIARTSGGDFAQVQNVYEDNSAKFDSAGGPYSNRHVVTGMHFIDNDNLIFMMGRQKYNDPFGDNPNDFPAYDIFIYTISTDLMVNITKTSGVPGDFEEFGKIIPAATFVSDNGRYYYVLRDGPSSAGTAASTNVLNIVAVDTVTRTCFDVTGDEISGTALIDNIIVGTDESRSPIESPAAMHFTEGSGLQDGLMYFSAHKHPAELGGVATDADEVFAFNVNNPFVGYEATAGSAAGTHVSNITPNPFGATVAFARTAGTDRLGADQHPFVVDLDNFLVQRDLTPGFEFLGQPVGRVMDGSFHFVPAGNGAVDALVFSIGLESQVDTGVAVKSIPYYYSLANVSDFLVEPVPTIIPLVRTAGLGNNFRIYVTGASLTGGP